MKIQIVTPAARGSRVGNRITALRWAIQLRSLGHGVRVREELDGAPCELLIALHAVKSAEALIRSKHDAPSRPVILVLTGTDIYGAEGDEAQPSLELADRLVVLQSAALHELSPAQRAKAEVVPQSARAPRRAMERDPQHFDVLVVAHLRAVKDPLLTARAARRLPESSRLRVRLIGGVLEQEFERAATREAEENPRFEWLGGLSFAQTQAHLSAARVLVVSSHNEGGPAVITEAIACGVPILSTRMPAALSLLGEDYPGLYGRGDVKALAELLGRCERETGFLEALRTRVVAQSMEVRPETERARLRALVEALVEA